MTLLNEPEIRRRTVEARNSARELTKAQKLADRLRDYVGISEQYAYTATLAEEWAGKSLPQPGANECEAGPELPLPFTVVVACGQHGVVWRAIANKPEMKCFSANGNAFYVTPGNWRYATDAEMDAFFTECPR